MMISSALSLARAGKRILWAAATVHGRNEAWKGICDEVKSAFPDATVIEHRARVEFDNGGLLICRVIGSEGDALNLAGMELSDANEWGVKFDRVRAQVERPMR